MEMNEEVQKNIAATNRLLLEMVKLQKQNTKDLIKLFIVTTACMAGIIISMVIGFVVYESQFEVLDTQYETYEYDQEVDGENSEINNVTGNLYKDNSTHNDNGEENN